MTALSLLQLVSPALPVGAFSYSEGLEVLIQAGDIREEAQLQAWLEAELNQGMLRLEGAALPLLAAAMLSGWSLTMVSSPFTAAMMIMSRFTGMTAGQIGLRWNGAFLATSLMMAAVLFRLAS